MQLFEEAHYKYIVIAPPSDNRLPAMKYMHTVQVNVHRVECKLLHTTADSHLQRRWGQRNGKLDAVCSVHTIPFQQNASGDYRGKPCVAPVSVLSYLQICHHCLLAPKHPPAFTPHIQLHTTHCQQGTASSIRMKLGQ